MSHDREEGWPQTAATFPNGKGAELADGFVLEVAHLAVDINTGTRQLRAVDDVSFEVRKGEVLGLVGESGSGKSITALSLLRLLPDKATITGGSIRFAGGVDLLGASPAQLQRLRGSRLAMIFQDPLTSLNPLMTIGSQLVEALRVHDSSVSRKSAATRGAELLRVVGFAEPTRTLSVYPHELSGGMRQRVMIAMAMCNHPDLVIADEPTTALDVTTQAQVLDALRAARDEIGSAMILITHDLGLVAEQADRVNVMYGGRIIEAGPTRQVLDHPHHPYTAGLLASRPSPTRKSPLRPIPGSPPQLFAPHHDCAFAPRCTLAQDRCRTTVPALRPMRGERLVACHFAEQVTVAIESPGEAAARRDSAPAVNPPPLLSVRDLTKEFGRRRRLLGREEGVLAVDGVSFDVLRGRTLALVGESGCGKSTIARAVLRLIEPSGGQIEFDGANVVTLRRSPLRAFRREAQLVQQDPYSALNPRRSIGEAIADPLRVHRVVPSHAVRSRVAELLEAVGLRPDHAQRFPHEFSGGQRQRICIARALSVEPRLLVLDEPVSSLDVSIQAQILNLLAEIQRTRELSFLFITHDLAVVRAVADEVAVMRRGRIVETGAASAVLDSPTHEYTRALLAAVPDLPSELTNQSHSRSEVPEALSGRQPCEL